MVICLITLGALALNPVGWFYQPRTSWRLFGRFCRGTDDDFAHLCLPVCACRADWRAGARRDLVGFRWAGTVPHGRRPPDADARAPMVRVFAQRSPPELMHKALSGRVEEFLRSHIPAFSSAEAEQEGTRRARKLCPQRIWLPPCPAGENGHDGRRGAKSRTGQPIAPLPRNGRGADRPGAGPSAKKGGQYRGQS
jgi:hypothetical protein